MYEKLKSEVEEAGARLVAISKKKAPEDILKLYRQGHRLFGENRAQELAEKQEQLPGDIKWHMVGHLQRNKVKYIAGFVDLIHSIDSRRLLKEVNKRAKREERRIDCLLQFKIAEEASKYGLELAEAKDILSSEAFGQWDNVRIVGVMGMASFVEDEQQVRREFKQLKAIFEALKADFFADDDHFREISMGMSGDYKIALEEGSTMVRIGTLLFGPRD